MRVLGYITSQKVRNWRPWGTCIIDADYRELHRWSPIRRHQTPRTTNRDKRRCRYSYWKRDRSQVAYFHYSEGWASQGGYSRNRFSLSVLFLRICRVPCASVGQRFRRMCGSLLIRIRICHWIQVTAKSDWFQPITRLSVSFWICMSIVRKPVNAFISARHFPCEGAW